MELIERCYGCGGQINTLRDGFGFDDGRFICLDCFMPLDWQPWEPDEDATPWVGFLSMVAAAAGMGLVAWVIWRSLLAAPF